MKFYSEYLKKDLEFATIQDTDMASGEPISIIPHESLLGIAKSENLNIAHDIVYASHDEAVIACTISDKQGKSVTWIGESNSMTLDNEIKQKYRFTMAWNQAFDRALIIFLQLPDRRVKSDMEINPSSAEKNLGPQMNGDNPYMNTGNQGQENAKTGTTTQAPKDKQTATNNVSAGTGQGNSGKQQQPKPQQKNQPTPESDGKIIITIGKFKNNKTTTIKDIYESDMQWMKWIAESGQFIPKNESDSKQYEAILRYYQYRQALNQKQK